jgi:ADP-ribose pyrophosphatase YjhB (NUDIX family)
MSNRQYPERPLIGVGGIVIENGRVLLVRRGQEPLLGQWSIPGGLLEAGETLLAGVEREIQEETGLTVRAVELVEAVERIFFDAADASAQPGETAPAPARPRYHYVVLDYLCERLTGKAQAGGDAAEIAFAHEDELHRYELGSLTLDVLHKAFALAKKRGEPDKTRRIPGQ